MSGPVAGAGTDAAGWHARAERLTFPTEAFVDGREVSAVEGTTRPTVDPATGSVLAHVAECGDKDVDAAVRAARAAFERGDWSRAHPRHRKAVLLRLAALVEANADELALLDSLDAGKLIADTTTIDVPGSAAILSWYAEAVDKVYGELAPTAP
jgi:4-(gamma-glutamylamino)butanal dehydrogenase